MIRFIDEFRQSGICKSLIAQIKKLSANPKFIFMEVCGGHTLTALKYSLHEILADNVELKSGPGCPVCVTPSSYIELACELARLPDLIITSFGDLLRVPGATSSLLIEKQKGAKIVICLSPLEAVNLAQNNPHKKIVFLGIGFETTAPAIASAILQAKEKGLENFFVLTALKTMPEALLSLASNPKARIDGFLCPGHVSTIMGTEIYLPLAQIYHKPCVVSGFEPADMLLAIYKLIEMLVQDNVEVFNAYPRAVKTNGNLTAKNILKEVFEPSDAFWRGLGLIKKSGLQLKDCFSYYDAQKVFKLNLEQEEIENSACRCGFVLRGEITPAECPLFKKSCSPENPIGACMVSSEGACNIYFRYAS